MIANANRSSYRRLPGPPDDVMPGQADLTVLLGVVDNIAVGLNRFRVWPGGFQCILSMRVGPANSQPLPYPQFHAERTRFVPVTAVLGLEYADGAFGESRHDPYRPAPVASARPIVMVPNGNGSNGWFDITYWAAPLPPPGPVVFWFTWAEAGLPRLTAQVDADILRRAAADTVDLWS
jgi:hypothetical protein